MLAHADAGGDTALTLAAAKGHAAFMRLLLEHPSADAAAMLVHADSAGWTDLGLAASEGRVDAMRVLLDHPSADAAAMLAFRTPEGGSAITLAAGVAAGSSSGNSSFAPLLLLLRRVAVEPQPCADQQAHMTKVLKMCHGGQKALLNVDQPDDSRDECVRLICNLLVSPGCPAALPWMEEEPPPCRALAPVCAL
jgi:hypothetical protein